MAYATEEERQFFLGNGWTLEPNATQWVKPGAGGAAQAVTAMWIGFRQDDLTVPEADKVFWSAVAAVDPGDGQGVAITTVVQFADQCRSPTTCFVLAELRGWEAP